MRLKTFAALMLTTISAAQAATIVVSPLGPGLPDMVIVAGELQLDDAEVFRAKTAFVSKAIVALQGPGGNVLASTKIGELIRFKNFATIVLDNEYCVSACALAWLGGTSRFMADSAKVGFHAASDGRSGEVSGVGNAIVGAYLNKLGLPTEAVAYITVASPKAMSWLTLADANRYGIEVSRPPETSSAAPSPQQTGEPKWLTEMNNEPKIGGVAQGYAYCKQIVQNRMQPTVPDHRNDCLAWYGASVAQNPENIPNRTTTEKLFTPHRTTTTLLEEEAAQFVRRYVHVETEPPEESLRNVESYYAESVLYYGKRISKRDVLRDYAKFVYRWPRREYALKAGSLVTSCSDEGVCNIEAVIEWVAASDARRVRSVGISTWRLNLRKQDNSFVITATGGEVLSRKISKYDKAE